MICLDGRIEKHHRFALETIYQYVSSAGKKKAHKGVRRLFTGNESWDAEMQSLKVFDGYIDPSTVVGYHSIN